MKNFNWKSLIPHVIAVAVFLIVALMYCKPVLQGKVLQQQDIVHWTGMSHSSFEYKEKHGHFPLWNTNLFSGMPNYQIIMDGHSFFPDVSKILTLGMPKPVSFFFLACICFYILCMALRINVVATVLSSLAYAYCSYDPVIISVGHDSKMMAIAYAPALLGGLLLVFEKKYFVGFFVTALFATLEIQASHPQINFYFAIVAFFATISYAIRWIKEKQWRHIAIACSVSIICVAIGFANSTLSLLPTAEYTKFTMRGGKLIENSAKGITAAKTTGLDEDYAFSYSADKTEFLTFLMPNARGGSSDRGFDENSKTVQALVNKNVPEANAAEIAAQVPPYWGGIMPSTSGPVYLGAIICFLFIVGMVLVDNKYRWWIFAAVFFGVVISWGKYFEGFNVLLFKYLPLYNKFRAPSMAMFVPQLLFPLLAALALQKTFFTPDGKAALKTNFKKILYITGGVFVFVLLVYVMADYTSDIDGQIKANFERQQQGFGNIMMDAIKDGRKEMLGNDILYALIFAGVTLGALYAYVKTSVKPVYIVVALLVVNTLNLIAVDSKYLDANSYVDDDSYTSTNFTPTDADNQILKDKDPHFRVLNLSGDWTNEAKTAYFHRCIGGYHPAKLSIYQDLIDNQIANNNQGVLDMLDTRYLLLPPRQQGQVTSVLRRDSALGACWFVKEVQFVNGPVEEMKALDKFNPRQTAFVENSFKTDIASQPAADSSASIKLNSYDNDDITYTSSSKTPQFAVFSEIYYPAGWNAYVDGKPAPYVKTNYVLRGLYVPAGSHAIEFKFEPSSYATGQTLTYIGNALLWLGLIVALWAWWNDSRKKTAGSQIKSTS